MRLRVVRGEATTTEVAALIAVVAAKELAVQQPVAPTRSAWSSNARDGRPPLRPGADAWRLSERPR
jgi:hypothetical protein